MNHASFASRSTPLLSRLIASYEKCKGPYLRIHRYKIAVRWSAQARQFMVKSGSEIMEFVPDPSKPDILVGSDLTAFFTATV